MRIIKRTKITVIRTETLFLKKQDGDRLKEILRLQQTDLTEINNNNSVLEIEAIKRIEQTESKGEKK